MSSATSAFNWRSDPRPSIFMGDTFFTGNRSGKTQSQTSSEAVQRFTKATGRNPGSIKGISPRGDKLIEEAVHRRRAR